MWVTDISADHAPSILIDVQPRILVEISTSEFFSTYYGRTSLLRRAAAQWVNPIATEQLCERLVRSDQVDFLAVRDESLSSASDHSSEKLTSCSARATPA